MDEEVGEEKSQVQVLPVGALALTIVGGQVVGCEVVWDDAIGSPEHAATALSTLMTCQHDARWVMRQVMRSVKETKPN